ncbi:TerC family protein [Luteibacter pinisoli]|uniref:TerC family protein n=1 Tax=Luteibacter pinisoli TaxID=2589080 RepID=A0A4Y5Z5B3_9GAMM|nr:TerC family protein [Luteibacter pinisoli]QDE40357.1 TerC family protein [Luteibacter pinisoli]
MFAFDWLADPSAWAGLLTLIVLEIVLGIDNLVFVAILADKLPARQRDHARLMGLGLALVMRLCLLAAMSWLVTLTQPLFQWNGFALSWRDIILLVGGAFLLFKATLELHERLEAGDEHDGKAQRRVSFWLTVAQIVILDAVFSLDSVITAVGMVDHLSIMMVGVVVAMALMITASKPLTAFVNARPTVIILCLSFLLMIGFSLIAEGFGFHIPKGYLYAAIGFSIMIEVFNQTMRRNRRRSLLLGGRIMRDRTAKAVLRLLGGTVDEEGEGKKAPDTTPTDPAVFGRDELEMVQGVLDLSQRPVRSIMTPRTEIVWVDPSDDLPNLLSEARESSHHWMLVANGDLDELIGVTSSRDLLASLTEHGRLVTETAVRKPITVLASLSVLRLIDEFRRAPLQVALVVDEYGSILGLVTPADVLEAIAGEFPHESGEGDPSAVSEPDGAWLLDASLDVRRVEHLLGHRLPGASDGNFATLAGFVLQRLGRLPGVGDTFESERLAFEVTAMDGARIQRVRVAELPPEED